MFCGYACVVYAMRGEYETAAPFIGFAVLLDMLDGRIARMTGTTSEFGGELDSLADVISFGVAPALLAYAWGFGTIPRVGWLAAFLFVTCGALRLARFNVQRMVSDGRFFVGLPIPAAAAQVAAWVLVLPQPLAEKGQALAALALLVTLAFLMVSTLRYRSFKKLDLRSRQSYIMVLGIALALVLIALHPKSVLLALASLYWLSGPTTYVLGLGRRRAEPPVPGGEATSELPRSA